MSIPKTKEGLLCHYISFVSEETKNLRATHGEDPYKESLGFFSGVFTTLAIDMGLTRDGFDLLEGYATGRLDINDVEGEGEEGNFALTLVKSFTVASMREIRKRENKSITTVDVSLRVLRLLSSLLTQEELRHYNKTMESLNNLRISPKEPSTLN
jgi:hypothetical protein